MAGLQDYLLTAPRSPYPVQDRLLTQPSNEAALQHFAARSATPFEGGFRSGVQNLVGGSKSAIALALEGLGADQFANGVYDSAAGNYRDAQRYAPAVGRIEDIGSLDEFGQWALGAMGNMGVYAPLGITGALGGRAMLGRKMGAEAAGLTGATATYAPSMVGEANTAMRNDPAAANMSLGERGLRSVLTGGAQAGANAFFPTGLTSVPTQGFRKALLGHTLSAGGGEAVEDVIGQANKLSYDPNARFDPMQTVNAAAAGAVGGSPFSVGHAAMSGAGQHVEQGLQKGKELAGMIPGMDALVGAAQQVPTAKAAMDAIKEGVGTAVDAAKTGFGVAKGYATDVINQYNTNREEGIGRVASAEDALLRTGQDIKTDAEVLKSEYDAKKAEETEFKAQNKELFAKHRKLASDDAHSDADAAELLTVYDRMREDGWSLSQKDTAHIDKLRETDPKAAYAALAPKLDRMRKASSESYLNELIKPRNGEGKASLLGTRVENDRAERNSDRIAVRDSTIERALQRSFYEEGIDPREASRTYSKFSRYMHRVAEMKARGDKGWQDARAALADVLDAELGAKGLLALKAVDAIQAPLVTRQTKGTNKSAAKEQLAKIKAKAHPLDVVKRSMLPNTDATEYDVVHRINKYESDLNNLRNKRRIDSGPETAADTEAQIEDLNTELSLDLHTVLSGSVWNVVDAVRQSENFYAGREDARALGAKSIDPSQPLSPRDAAERAFEFGTFEDEKSFDGGDNQMTEGVSTTDEASATGSGEKWFRLPEYRTRGVHGHPSPDHKTPVGGKHGSFGGERAAIAMDLGKDAARMPGKADGKKPNSDFGTGHTELGWEDAWSRAAVIASEDGGTAREQLDKLAGESVAHEVDRAKVWEKDLTDRGVDVDAGRQLLEAEYARVQQANAAAKTQKTTQEYFDGIAMLEASGYTKDDAVAISAVFWAQKKMERLMEDGADKFFQKFRYEFPITRTSGSSGETLTAPEIQRNSVKDTEGKVAGTPDNGYLAFTPEGADHERFVDLPRLMRESMNRTRGRSVDTNPDVGAATGPGVRDDDIVRDLYDDKGNVNMEYLTALRTAYGNMLRALHDSGITFSEADMAALTDNSTLLVRGKEGRNGERVGDITAAEILGSTEKKVSFDPDTEVPKLLTTKSTNYSEGYVGGYKDADGNAVRLNAPAIIRATAAKLGVDIRDPSRPALLQLLVEGVDALVKSGAVDGPSVVRRTTNAAGKAVYALSGPWYTQGDGFTLFNREMLKGEDGKPLNDGKRVVNGVEAVKLRVTDVLDGLPGKFALEPAAQKVARLQAFMGVIEREITAREEGNRIVGESDVLTEKLNRAVTYSSKLAEQMALLKVSTGTEKEQIQARLALTEKALSDIQSEIEKVESRDKTREMGAPSKLATDLARKDDILENEVPKANKNRQRSDITQSLWSELQAKYDNLYEAYFDQIGQNDEVNVQPNIPGTGHRTHKSGIVETATTQKMRGKITDPAIGKDKGSGVEVNTERLGSAFVSENDIPNVPKRAGTASQLPARPARTKTETDAEFAARVKTWEDANKAVTAKDSAALRNMMGPRELPDAPATAARDARKEDQRLQQAITNWNADKGFVLGSVADNALKAFYDNAKGIDTPSAKNAVSKLTDMAAQRGVDLKTGEYKAEAVTESYQMPNATGIKTGVAEAVLVDNRIKFSQDGKHVGTLFPKTMPELAVALAGGPINVVMKPVGREMHAVAKLDGTARKMEPYTGNRDIPTAPKNQLPDLTAPIRASNEVKTQRAEEKAFEDTLVDAMNKVPTGNKLPSGKPLRGSASIFGDLKTEAERVAAQNVNLFLAQALGEGKFELHVSEAGSLGSINGQPIHAFVDDKLTPEGKAVVRLALGTEGDVAGNRFHEAIHAVWRAVVDNGSAKAKEAFQKFDTFMQSGMMKTRIEAALTKALPNNPDQVAAIMKEINSRPEEAAAYGFQLWSLGLLNFGAEHTGVLGRIKKFVMGLMRMTTEASRMEKFAKAFALGDLAKAEFKDSAFETAFGELAGDRLFKNIGDALKPVTEVMRRVFDSSVRGMERLESEHANELLRLYTGRGEKEGFIHKVTQKSREFASQVQRILDGHSKEDVQAGLEELLRGDDPKTDAGKALFKFIAAVNTYAGRDERHIPNIWDHDKIGSQRAEFEQALRDYGMKDDKNTIDSAAVLDILRNMGIDKYTDKARLDFLPEFREQKTEWLQKDPSKFLRSFIMESVRRAEHRNVFGQAGRKTVTDLLDNIKREKGSDAYWQAKTTVDGWEGELGKNMHPGIRKAMHAALTLGNVITLPFALFSAMMDPMHIASRSSQMGEAFSAYGKGLSSIPRTVKTLFGGKDPGEGFWRRYSEDVGAIEHAMMTDALGDIYTGDNVGGFAKKVNDWFFKANFLDGWTRSMRVAAVEAANRFLIAHSKGENEQHSQHYLEELGLTKADIKVETMKDEDGKVHEFIVPTDKVRNAINQFVDEAVVRPDQSTNATWMNDPRFMLLAHMKRFTFAFDQNILQRVTREAGRQNFAPMMNLLPSIGIIIAADSLKHMIKGDYDTWMKGKGFLDYVQLGVERSGITGKFQFGLDAAEDIQRSGTPIDSFLGPEYGLLRKASGVQRLGADETGMVGMLDDALLAYRASDIMGQYSKQRAANEPAPAPKKAGLREVA